jgi:lipopolysaccharide transport system permease protein
MGWSIVIPATMLVVYTFVFTVIFKVRWSVEVNRPAEFALALFSGLIVFQLFSECITRAPSLLLENIPYIKKVVFPLEVLGWVSVGTAFVNALLSSSILIFGYVLIKGIPPLSAVTFPFVFFPFILLLLGLVWLFSSLGVYVRDLKQVIGAIIPLFLFLSPVFYPIEALPTRFRSYIYVNPLTFIIEQLRSVLLYGSWPDIFGLSIYSAIAMLMAWMGYVWFSLTKYGFSDVV